MKRVTGCKRRSFFEIPKNNNSNGNQNVSMNNKLNLPNINGADHECEVIGSPPAKKQKLIRHQKPNVNSNHNGHNDDQSQMHMSSNIVHDINQNIESV